MIKLIKRWINRNYYTIVHTAHFTYNLSWDDGCNESIIFDYVIKHYPNRVNKFELSTTQKVKTSARFEHMKYYWNNNVVYVNCLKKISELQQLTPADIREGKLNQLGIK